MPEKEKSFLKYWEANSEKLDTIRQLWDDGKKLDYVSFLRAAAERPEMAGEQQGDCRRDSNRCH